MLSSILFSLLSAVTFSQCELTNTERNIIVYMREFDGKQDVRKQTGVPLSQALVELNYSGTLAPIRRAIEYGTSLSTPNPRYLVESPLQFINHVSYNSAQQTYSFFFEYKVPRQEGKDYGSGVVSVLPDGRLDRLSFGAGSDRISRLELRENELESYTRLALQELQLGGPHWRLQRTGREADAPELRDTYLIAEMHPRANISTGNLIQFTFGNDFPEIEGQPDFSRVVFFPRNIYISYAGNNFDPRGPLLNLQQVQQRAADFVYQRFGALNLKILVFAPQFMKLLPDDQLNTNMVGPTKARTRHVRSLGKRLAVHQVYVSTTDARPQTLLMDIDSETGDVINAGFTGSGQGSATDSLPPLDLTKPFMMDGEPKTLAWRKSFLTPEGAPAWFSQGDNPARAHWIRGTYHETLNLYMIKIGGTTYVAPAAP